MGFVASTAVVDQVTVDSESVVGAIYNVTCTLANTEYSQALPADSKGFIIQCRSSDDIKLAFVVSQSGTNYVTIKSGYAYNNDKKYGSLTLYFQSPTAGAVVEIVSEA